MNTCGMTSPIFHVQPRHLDSGRILCFHPIGYFHCTGERSWFMGHKEAR
ncbi:rCG44452 [Rattus norvegicus]|uniref:RCG44452 n=1 Tax=Rattus norvegicus TaxID=10116 RepID=A6I4X0_RAT|nr:rCG44452 [Rattus norvegicus]